jgi:hypothetical protein
VIGDAADAQNAARMLDRFVGVIGLAPTQPMSGWIAHDTISPSQSGAMTSMSLFTSPINAPLASATAKLLIAE